MLKREGLIERDDVLARRLRQAVEESTQRPRVHELPEDGIQLRQTMERLERTLSDKLGAAPKVQDSSSMGFGARIGRR